MNYVENASWVRRNRGETEFHAKAGNSRLVDPEGDFSPDGSVGEVAIN
jgi:hypothetical protein